MTRLLISTDPKPAQIGGNARGWRRGIDHAP